MIIITLAEVVAICILIYLIGNMIHQSIKQARCKHEHVFENRQCNAICRDCRKDLGFIQTWRDKQRAKEQQS